MKDKTMGTQILYALKTQALPAGAIALSEQLGLAQATVGRELNRLEQDGYLVKVSNKGRILSKKGEEYIKQEEERQKKEQAAGNLIDFSDSLSPARLVEILEVRKLLEPETIRLTCEKATTEELESLRSIMLEHLYEINNGGIGSAQDLKLHLAIAKYSQNETLHQLLLLLLTTKNAYTEFSLNSKSFLLVQAEHHHEIVQALLLRDKEKATAAMEVHLDTILDQIRILRDHLSFPKMQF